MNVLLIEDEALTADRLAHLLHQYDPGIQILDRIPSVEEAVAWFRSPGRPKPELIFMDVRLEDETCFRIFEQVNLTTPVIFTTAYDEYLLQAFKVNSVDYLLKPVAYEALAAALEKFRVLKQELGGPDLSALLQQLQLPAANAYKQRFMVTVGSRIRSVPTETVAYFYSQSGMTFLVQQDGTQLPIDFSLDKLSTLIDPAEFFRLNRQFLARHNSIRNVHIYSPTKLKLELLPKTREEVFVSSERMGTYKEWLGK